MTVKNLVLTLVTLSFLINPLSAHAKRVYLEPGDFLSQSFPKTSPDANRLLITGDLKTNLRKVLSGRYSKIRIPYWQSGNKTAWILERIGKERPITAGFVVEDNRIVSFKVLIFRESRGWEIHNEFFTEQFYNAYLKDKQKLSNQVDNITGATMSVNAMKTLAQMALLLHAEVISKNSTP